MLGCAKYLYISVTTCTVLDTEPILAKFTINVCCGATYGRRELYLHFCINFGKTKQESVKTNVSNRYFGTS